MNLLHLPSNLKGVYQQWQKLQQVHKLAAKRDWYVVISKANELTEGQENDFFGYYYKGIDLTGLKLFDEACENFEHALANLKKNRFPMIMEEYEQEIELRMVHLFRLQRLYERALERLNQLIDRFPNYIGAYKSKAGIYIDLEHLQKALNTINEGLRYHSTDPELLKLRESLIFDLTTQRKE